MTDLAWWQSAVFYQIYPRSFADTNGNGIGDLAGILERLDYLSDLGIGAIWLSPFFPSPQFDIGYDVSNYIDVDPEYGTLDDFRNLLDAAHRRGIRIILDLVMNHTSNQHPWFIESASSRDNPKRDWYIWRDGVADGPPNNWNSFFDEVAWTYHEKTGQWYYHHFFPEQPDLNWRNPEVKEAMWDVVRFWLDFGVDGFRLDAIASIYEDQDLTDHTAELDLIEQFRRQYEYEKSEQKDPDEWDYLFEQRRKLFEHQYGLDGIHELFREMRALVDEYDDRMLVGEVWGPEYHGSGSDELHMVFNFPLMWPEEISPKMIRENQQQRLSELPAGAWPCNTLNNHDSSRTYSQKGDGKNDDALARLSMALLLTLKGTPFLYYGEEIGMRDMLLSSLDQVRDNVGLWYYRKAVENLGLSEQEAEQAVLSFTRDRCRTPMQWSPAANAGVSPAGVETWLPVHPTYREGVNVADQAGDSHSMLEFTRTLLAVRKNNPALVAGEYQPLNEENEQYFAFLRSTAEQRCLVVLNYSAGQQSAAFDLGVKAGKLIFSSGDQPENVRLDRVALSPFEVLLIAIS